MADTMTIEEARHYFATRELPERLQKNGKKKSNKYNAVRTEYKGEMYDSKREAKHAAELDLLKRAGEVKKWVRQFPIELRNDALEVLTGKVICTYRIDFKVWWTDGGRITYDEVKGFETDLWKVKWKLAHKQHPDWEFRLIK